MIFFKNKKILKIKIKIKIVLSFKIQIFKEKKKSRNLPKKFNLIRFFMNTKNRTQKSAKADQTEQHFNDSLYTSFFTPVSCEY